MTRYFRRWQAKNTCPPRKPLKKILWSGIGAFVGILLIGQLEQWLRQDGLLPLLMIGPFGASAALIYGAPQAEFSQPRNLIGGHVLSAIIGVTMALLFTSQPLLAGALAVSFSVMAMLLARVLHPPGGATALIAVIGGDAITAMGYRYALAPVLAGACILLLVALVVNNLSRNPARHYPVYWFR